MKKFFYVLAVSVFLSGCATVYEPYELVRDPDPAVRRFISFHQIQKGMTSAEVKAVLGKDVVIGYELPDIAQERYRPVVKENPLRIENYEKGSRQYVVEYYLTGIHQGDDVIFDEELTPLVFEQDKLVGWGWEFLRRIKD